MNLESTQIIERHRLKPMDIREQPIAALMDHASDNGLLRVVVVDSIHKIDEECWDRLNANHDLFHTHRFIRSLEDAGIEHSQSSYLLVYRGELLVGTAALSLFVVSLDLFLGPALRKLVSGVRSLYASFMKIPILFCGLPISIGKQSIAFADTGEGRDIVRCIGGEMKRICRQEYSFALSQGIS